jgi:SRSO17 transposase
MARRSRFAAYVERIAGVFGHADRAAPFRAYCAGLLLPGERKSIGPMAERLEPRRAPGAHQSLHHFVANSAWSDEALLRRVRELVLPSLAARGGVQAWAIDETAFRKSGAHSVGVARQPCGEMGRVENCQIAVSLSLVNAQASLPIAFRLYLPESWAADAAQRLTAGVPENVAFKTQSEIALDQIRAARADGVPEGVVLADALHGADIGFRAALAEMDLSYIVGAPSLARVWPLTTAADLGEAAASAKPRRRDGMSEPLSAEQLAKSLPPEAWRNVAWREEDDRRLTSRFAVLRVRASRNDEGPRPLEEERLLVEWPSRESAPTEYWLSALPAQTPVEGLVETAKLRWRSRRDLETLRQELGFGHYEGRGWRGFHHHLALCVAAYGFLVWDEGGSGPGERARPLAAPHAPPHRPPRSAR